MKKPMFIIILVIFALAVVFYFLFPWSWSKWNPSWTIKNTEEIQDISFTVTEPSSDTATAVVYLRVDGSAEKLSPTDSITVNQQPMEPQYYNNGTAVGYKYILDIKKSDEYILVLKRETGKEMRRVITPVTVTFTLPPTVSKSQGVVVAYKAEPLSAKDHFVIDFSSLNKDVGPRVNEDRVITDDYRSALTIEPIVKVDKLIVEPSELKIVKMGKVLMKVAGIYYQSEGVFVIADEREVEIVE